jgi:hypothetical protein
MDLASNGWEPLDAWRRHGIHPLLRPNDRESPSQFFAALEIFLARTPIAALKERVCGNSLRCVVRLIIYALFQVEYKEVLVAW